MGGTVHAEVWATTERAVLEILDRMQAGVATAESTLTLEDEGSELRRLNVESRDGAYFIQNRDLYRCIRLALDYAKASEGVFDPTLRPLTRLYERDGDPADEAVEAALERVGWERVILEREALAVRFRGSGMELDLSGIAPGYALDIAARSFALPGSRAGLLRFGAHLYVWGVPPGQDSLRISVPDPRDPARSLGELRVKTRGIAASARVDRRGPLLDPATGRPTTSNVLVAMALADSAADADVIGTALLVGGSLRAGALLSKTHRVEALLLVDEEGRDPYLLASGSLRGRFEPSAALLREAPAGIRFLLPPAQIAGFAER